MARKQSKLRDAISLQENGFLDRDPVSASRRKYFQPIIIDTMTGAITASDGERSVWHIIQKGSTANDHVMTPQKYGPADLNSFAANAATDFFRLRAWADRKQVTFIAFELSTLISGTCEVIQ